MLASFLARSNTAVGPIQLQLLTSWDILGYWDSQQICKAEAVGLLLIVFSESS